jgi:hypothetical protein
MKRTLQVLNELERDGVVERYAIGGAMAATFYVEPLLTFDLDVFVILPQNAAHLLSLAPLYEALRAHGYVEEGECVLIEGMPVQFLPAYNELLAEALREARETMYEDVSARVVRAEHLIAICLQTGQDKDRERVRILREQAELDRTYSAGVLQRHGLEGKGRGSHGDLEAGGGQAIRSKGSAPSQAGKIALSGKSTSGGAPAGNGCAGIARPRQNGSRMVARYETVTLC